MHVRYYRTSNEHESTPLEESRKARAQSKLIWQQFLTQILGQLLLLSRAMAALHGSSESPLLGPVSHYRNDFFQGNFVQHHGQSPVGSRLREFKAALSAAPWISFASPFRFR